MYIFSLLVIILGVHGLDIPESCNREQFYDSGSLTCLTCPANNSMVRSLDGFGCACEEHSVPSGFNSCRPCNATQVVSADGTSCVPRKCQNTSGRFVCRKCPADYISVTQNFDGSPTKEVLCVKCARGYKVESNTCVKCDACACSKNHVVVKNTCIPKAYVNDRPKYEEKLLHPLDLLDIVKYEYLCTQNDNRACRTLTNLCVKNFYSTDHGGPCRLWVQPKITIPKGLPSLVITPSPGDRSPGEIIVSRRGVGSIFLALAIYTFNGGMRFLRDVQHQMNLCQLPINIKIGEHISCDCSMNLTNILSSDWNETLAPYLYVDGEYRPLSVSIMKPNGYNVQQGTWISSNFRRYFIVHNSISTTSNTTNTIYLRTLLIRIRLERVKHVNGSLRIMTALEAQYATKSMHDSVETTLKVEHDMPNAGVVRGLEICGGVLGAFLSLFAVVQWRGVLHRGGLLISVVPLLAGSIADTLYFATLFSTLHALAAEAGTLGITLPLSRSEERIIKAFLYSAVGLKAVKIAWINWKQCTCDIFFLNWAEYNPTKESVTENESWKAVILAREWSSLQVMRRASPGFTITLALLVLHLMSSWKSLLPRNDGYNWAVVSIAWWCSYTVVLLTSWLKEKFLHSRITTLPNICTGVGLSLIVFQEEYYAHYVHGRNDNYKEARSMSGLLATGRVACVPQLRAVYRQLSSPGPGALGETESRHALLSRFLAAFFERALDGLNWVASERTIFERLLDVELTTRNAGSTSALLHDDDNTPSCLAMTWWGEEWNLSTFDAMLFSSVFIASGDALLAALIAIIVWQAEYMALQWYPYPASSSCLWLFGPSVVTGLKYASRLLSHMWYPRRRTLAEESPPDYETNENFIR